MTAAVPTVVHYRPLPRHLRRGFGLLDLLLSLGITAVATASFLTFQADSAATLKASGAADFVSTVSAAAQSYLNANAAVLQQNLGGGGVASIPVTGTTLTYGLPSIQSSGLLPSTFQNRDSYGQSTAFLVRDVAASGNTPEHLEGLVITTGGAAMPDKSLGQAMQKIGGSGGALLAFPPTGTPGTTIAGLGGTWSTPVANWKASGVTPAVGHLAANVNQLTGPVSEYLDRYNTGNPEANRMHTSIDVNGNNLNNVANTDTETVSNSRGSQIDVNSQLQIVNGGEACTGNATGCGWQISDDGGFYDNNDGWITFKGNFANTGIKLTGAGNNLEVDGKSNLLGQVTAQNGIELTGQFTFAQHGAGIQMTDDKWVRAFGGNGFEGISAAIMQAAMFQDSNDPAYYVQPSQSSYLNQLQAANLEVTGNAQVDGNLTVKGTGQFGGDLKALADLYVAGTAHVTGDVDAGNNVNAGNDVDAGHDVDAVNSVNTVTVNTAGNVNVGGAVTFTKKLGWATADGRTCAVPITPGPGTISVDIVTGNPAFCGADNIWHDMQGKPSSQ